MNRKTCLWVSGAAVLFGIGGFGWGMSRPKSDVHTKPIKPIIIEYNHGYFDADNKSETLYSYEVRNYPVSLVADAYNHIRNCKAVPHDDKFDGTAYVSLNRLICKKLIIYPHGKDPDIEYFKDVQYNEESQKSLELLIQQLYY